MPVASIPSMTGMRTSIRITSGSCCGDCRRNSIAWAPSAACELTMMFGSLFSIIMKPVRAPRMSSTSMTLMMSSLASFMVLPFLSGD